MVICFLCTVPDVLVTEWVGREGAFRDILCCRGGGRILLVMMIGSFFTRMAVVIYSSLFHARLVLCDKT